MKKFVHTTFSLDTNRFLGGYRQDNTPWYWFVKTINHVIFKNEPTKITAVCAFVHLKEEAHKMVVVKNKRGYDIPGGHVESNELPLEALCRELKEEANTVLENPKPFMLLESDLERHSKTGLLLYQALGTLKPFKSSVEISERRLLTTEEFLSCYYGNKKLMHRLLSQPR